MDRRTFEGPMDWEYEKQGPVDPTSPFVRPLRKPPMGSFGSPNKIPNPFLSAKSINSPAKPQQQQDRERMPPPPNSSFFNPQINKQFSGSSFRNPAFTTPQKRVEEVSFSEMSGMEDSPGQTDNSEMPLDTPECDLRDEFARSTITPATANRTLFGKNGSSMRSRTPGRGEIPRGRGELTLRDKVRKRKRQTGDRDVGSVRSRLPHDSDDSDSDWDSAATHKMRSPRKKQQKGPGFIGRMFTAIHDHPSLPIILSWYVQLGVNLVIVGTMMWGGWLMIGLLKADFGHATEIERSKLMSEMAICRQEYIANKCAPDTRAPALMEACEQWDLCMHQDPTAVMQFRVSAKNVAEIVNDVLGVLSLKSWGFILSIFALCLGFNNYGWGKFRESHSANFSKPEPLRKPSQSAGLALPPTSGEPMAWVPISQTPRHFRRQFLVNDEGTDTDNSPTEQKAIMGSRALQRSPGKGERGRSPTKYGRSPSKGY